MTCFLQVARTKADLHPINLLLNKTLCKCFGGGGGGGDGRCWGGGEGGRWFLNGDRLPY